MKTNEQSLKNLGDADLEHHGKLRAFENFFEQQFARLRLPGLVFFLVVTVFLGYFAAQLRPDASLQKMVPASHPYIVNYLKYENELRPLGNVIRVAVENTRGEIYDREFLETLKKITDGESVVICNPGDASHMQLNFSDTASLLEARSESELLQRVQLCTRTLGFDQCLLAFEYSPPQLPKRHHVLSGYPAAWQAARR